MSLPKYGLNKDKYDQSTFKGRIRHFFEVFNPILLFTPDKNLKEANNLLNDFASGKIENDCVESNLKLWEAKVITESILHPQTQEKIPHPFRFSAFVPVNIPIVVGIVTSASPAGQLFWQWFNQSYNVAVNHCNGNKTHPLPRHKVIAAYFSAVTVSCGLVFSLGKTVAPITRYSKILGVAAKALVPFVSVAAAGASNALLMRFNDCVEGVEVKDKEGTVRGVSTSAGRDAVFKTCLTRAAMPIPTILFPAIITSVVERANVFGKAPGMALPFNVALVSVILFVSLPLSIGMFPRLSSIETKDMEPKFQDLELKSGEKVTKLYYDKGL